jgi:hypothetical protein
MGMPMRRRGRGGWRLWNLWLDVSGAVQYLYVGAFDPETFRYLSTDSTGYYLGYQGAKEKVQRCFTPAG